MKKIALASLLLGLLAVAPGAWAQCPPGSWLCADITVGSAPPPPPPVYYVPPPPPPPPTVYMMPPPPPRVYVLRPPMVIYTPPTRYYLPPQQPYYVGMYNPPRRNAWVGLEAMGTFSFAPTGMFGLGVGLRFRGTGHFGLEAAVGSLWGTDYNGDFRQEIPVSLSGLFYFNPRNRVQIYGLLGVNTSFASVAYSDANVGAHGGRDGDGYVYFGGQAGLGAEFQITQRFSLFADVRGVLRTRIDDDSASNPEFSRQLGSGATQTTNSSIGATGQLGAVLYF